MITIKSEADLIKMRAAGLIIARILEKFEEMVKPGITTLDLERFAASYIRENGASPAFKGVIGGPDIPPYPCVICASVNEELVHGVPSDRVLVEGDIISVDVGCKRDGFHGDAARTYAVGDISPQAKRLLDTTKSCLEAATECCKPGAWLFDIGRTVSAFAHEQGFSVVEDYVGHGIGRELHEDPQVPNYVPRFSGFRNMVLRKGMVLALEPMINEGTYRTYRPRGVWTVRTADRKLCAHFENTVAILDDGPAILTVTQKCPFDRE